MKSEGVEITLGWDGDHGSLLNCRTNFTGIIYREREIWLAGEAGRGCCVVRVAEEVPLVKLRERGKLSLPLLGGTLGPMHNAGKRKLFGSGTNHIPS